MQVLKGLVERCWHQDPAKRPSFMDIVKDLDAQITKLPRREVMGSGTSGGASGGQGSNSCCSLQ